MRNEMTQVTQRIISRGKSWPIPTTQILSFPFPDNTYREERLSRTKRGNRRIRRGDQKRRQEERVKRREGKSRKKRHHPAGGTDNRRRNRHGIIAANLLRFLQHWLVHCATTTDALVMPRTLCRRFRFFPSVALAFTIHFPYRMRRTRLTAP